jgi:hypothetical protein
LGYQSFENFYFCFQFSIIQAGSWRLAFLLLANFSTGAGFGTFLQVREKSFDARKFIEFPPGTA